MDYDEFRAVLDNSGVDLWTLIDAAIGVASIDHGGELRQRRDGIVERLYSSAPSSSSDRLRNQGREDNTREAKVSGEKTRVSPSTPQSVGGSDSDEEGGLDPYGGLFDDEQKKILEIKEQIEESDQSEEALVELLQNLADMDITFQALKETDIGRHVNRLRKHSSSEVKRLVKQLVRKWKDTVDEWVKVNQPGEHTSSALMDGDSPQRKISHNIQHQVPDFTYSPNPHNGSSGSERNNSEPEQKPKPVAPLRNAPPKPTTPSVSHSVSKSTPQSQNRQREQKDSNFDLDRLASARKRLQANYKEAENAKRQRTIQVMDIHEIPKPKNSFFAKNKGGGGGSVGRHW